jgi:branched-chain amino acid transport system ATP-binding protein
MTAPHAPLLELHDLCSGYGKLQVLFGVTLTVGEGEIVALMGSNGAGKTTTLRTIVGQLPATSGSVLLAGNVVISRQGANETSSPSLLSRLLPKKAVSPDDLVAQGLVLVPEGRGMLRDLTVEENLEVGASTNSNSSRRKELFERTYDTFPILAERRKQRAGTLSGGQQQMLALGRALMADPRIMLVDEASLGLSPIMTETAFNLIADVNRTSNVAVLLVEQNVLALDLADRAYVLEKGQIVATAEGQEVRSMQGRLREVYLGASA